MRRAPYRDVVKTCPCGVVFLGKAQSRSCPACAALHKRQSDKAHQQRMRDFERRDHLSPAQVERVFTEALAQIRRERRYTGEMSSSHSWKYQEPGR